MDTLDREARVEIEAEAGVDRLLGGAQRLRGTGAELSGQPGGSVVDIAVGQLVVRINGQWVEAQMDGRGVARPATN